jgi:hypothetical protein
MMLQCEPFDTRRRWMYEEIPRSGVTLTRSMQYLRWVDGATYLWVARKKQAGQGEANSGLQFDTPCKSQ